MLSVSNMQKEINTILNGNEINLWKSNFKKIPIDEWGHMIINHYPPMWIPYLFFTSLFNGGHRLEAPMSAGASPALPSTERSLQKLPLLPTPDSNEVQNLLQTCEHLWTGSHRSPQQLLTTAELVWLLPATWGATQLRPQVPREQNQDRPMSVHSWLALITWSGFAMDFDIRLASVPHCCFLKTSNYSRSSAANWTSLETLCVKSWWILVRFSSNSWINFRDVGVIYGLDLINIGAIFPLFSESGKQTPSNTLTAPFRQSILPVGCILRLFLLSLWTLWWGILSVTFSGGCCVSILTLSPQHSSQIVPSSHIAESLLWSGSSERWASGRTMILLGFLG